MYTIILGYYLDIMVYYYGIYFINTMTGWWLSPTPLKNDGRIVSWDYESPNWMESHKIPWFQTTNQFLLHIIYRLFQYLDTITVYYFFLYLDTINHNSIHSRFPVYYQIITTIITIAVCHGFWMLKWHGQKDQMSGISGHLRPKGLCCMVQWQGRQVRQAWDTTMTSSTPHQLINSSLKQVAP